MRVTFNIRPDLKSKKTNMVPVAMTITHDGFKIRKMLSGINVLEKDWSSYQQRMKPSKKDESYNNCAQHNATMDELSKNLNKMWTHHLLDEKGDLTKQMILEFLDGKQESIISNEEIRFIDCFEEFINQSESHRAPRTITGYKTVKKILENFFDQTGFNNSLNDIDLKFFDRLRNYCFVERTYRNNMFARIITNIKTVMKWAEDRNYHSNLTYMKFFAPEEEIEVVFLTMDELMRLYNHTFTKETKYLEKIRDIYCFSCFTGLRYSDLANLKHSNIKENEIKITVRKTKTQDHIIPLTKFSLEILNRYKNDFGGPLPMISSQKLNEYIKLACKEAKIDSPINITRFSGSKRIESIKYKYELITMHTGRKTFVTNSLVMGMNQAVIKSITGHKSDSSFRKYVKISDNVNKNEMEQFWNQIKTT